MVLNIWTVTLDYSKATRGLCRHVAKAVTLELNKRSQSVIFIYFGQK